VAGHAEVGEFHEGDVLHGGVDQLVAEEETDIEPERNPDICARIKLEESDVIISINPPTSDLIALVLRSHDCARCCLERIPVHHFNQFEFCVMISSIIKKSSQELD
jgi:hypothetical protein